MLYEATLGQEQRPSAITRASTTLVSLMGFLDAGIVALALWWVADGQPMFDGRSLGSELLQVMLIVLLVSSVFKLSRSWRGVRLRTEFVEVTIYAAVTFFAISASYYILGMTPVDQASEWLYFFVRTYALAYCGIILVRLVARILLRYHRANGGDLRYAAIIGDTTEAGQLLNIFADQAWMGIRSIGVFDDSCAGSRTLDSHVQHGANSGVELTGSIESLHEMAVLGMVDRIYITLPASQSERINAIIERFHNTTVSIFYSPPVLKVESLNARWDSLYGRPVLSVVDTPFEGVMGQLKRLEDLALLALILPFALPVMLAIGLAVRATSEGPALFRQKRYGLDGKPFTIRKFRTMYVENSSMAFKQATKDDPRVTRLGRFLRKTSLDELPQLLNVLDGSMSVIGPRPHPVRLDDEYRDRVRRYMLRNKIKPGITGLAQVRGWRGETQTLDLMEHRIRTDIEYMANWSFWLDFQILLRPCYRSGSAACAA
ncbi:MAG: undecaprenyl-phosphate glucose phosphotransferase, partial [Pseudomonadota bacterium]